MRFRVFVQRLRETDWSFTTIEFIYFSLPILFFVFMGLAAILVSYAQPANAESINVEDLRALLDFVWQLIVFTFGLAGVVLAIDAGKLKSSKSLSLLAFLFIFAGVLLIIGYGLITIGTMNSEAWVGKMGSVVFAISLLPLSLGITVMFMEALNRILRKD